MGKRHVDAALYMVALKGGLGAIGTNRYLTGVMKLLTTDEKAGYARIPPRLLRDRSLTTLHSSQAELLLTQYSHLRTDDMKYDNIYA